MSIKRIPKQPTRPIDFVATTDLVDDLLLALKDVVACQSVLASETNGRHPNKTNELELQKLRQSVNKVVTLRNRVNGRGAELEATLDQMGGKLDLDLARLLLDCLRFPEVFPYVRNKQGLKKFFLCYCGKNETADQHGLRLCTDCLEAALECLKDKKKDDRFILYSSHSQQVRCRHADFKTLLITFYIPGQWLSSWCEICLQQEKARLSH